MKKPTSASSHPSADTQEQQDKKIEALCFAVLEHFPTMVFSKDANLRTRHNDQLGFRYVYFNALMDHTSGLKRLEMIGQNANDHFNPTDAQQYFIDDRQVMALPPNKDNAVAVLDFYESWIVPTGKHVNHTRKKNLGDTYMLGTFLIVDNLHLGKIAERRRSVLPPLSEAPPSPAPLFFSEAFEHLPVPVLVVSVVSPSSSSLSSSSSGIVLKNRAYHYAFGSAGATAAAAAAAAISKDGNEGEDEEEGEAAVDRYLLDLNLLAVPGEILERSNVVFSIGEGSRVKQHEKEQRGKEEVQKEETDEKEMPKWHVMQRPLCLVEREGEGKEEEGELVLVYVLWPQGDEGKAAAARAKLNQ